MNIYFRKSDSTTDKNIGGITEPESTTVDGQKNHERYIKGHLNDRRGTKKIIGGAKSLVGAEKKVVSKKKSPLKKRVTRARVRGDKGLPAEGRLRPNSPNVTPLS